LKRINKIINNSDFSKNVFTLFTGQLVAQTIAFVVGFVITRLYSPEQLGLYATFVAITTILSIVATGRYDAAIVVEKDDKKISALWLLSLLISVGFNLTLLVVLYFFSDVIFSKFKIIDLNKWAVFIPLAVFISSIIKLTQFYYNKYISYKWIRNSDIIKSVANSTLSISLFKWLTGGLIFANIIGSAVSLVYLFAKLPQDFWVKIKAIISLPELAGVAKKYKNYLTLYSLSGILNALVSNGTPIFIVYFFTEKTAGYYFMAEKVVSIPIGLIVAAISKVFYQKAAELYKEDKIAFLSLIKKIQKKMFYFLVPFLLVLTFLAPYFFKLFGEGWEYAGEMVKYFAVLLLFSNMVSPVGFVSNVINKLDVLLYFNISIAFFRGLTFYLGSLYLSFEYALLFSSIVISTCYLVLDTVLKRIIKQEIKSEEIA
jgi:O-antigen/teichoic acid export membrane protein